MVRAEGVGGVGPKAPGDVGPRGPVMPTRVAAAAVLV